LNLETWNKIGHPGKLGIESAFIDTHDYLVKPTIYFTLLNCLLKLSI